MTGPPTLPPLPPHREGKARERKGRGRAVAQ